MAEFRGTRDELFGDDGASFAKMASGRTLSLEHLVHTSILQIGTGREEPEDDDKSDGESPPNLFVIRDAESHFPVLMGKLSRKILM